MGKDYFRHARHVSFMSDFPKCHTGCVVTYKGKIMATGFNSSKTHPLQKIYNKERFDEDTPHTIHAETHALAQIMHTHEIDWGKVRVYVYRETKKGKIAMARPCASCMKLIRDLGIKRVNYTTEGGYASEVLI